MYLPYSQSCENNREPILAVLKAHLNSVGKLLEIGSGTGQHAVYFAPEFPDLIWQTSDRTENHAGINAWQMTYPSHNLRPPIALDVLRDVWPAAPFDAVFSANTAHIMRVQEVAAMFAGVGRILNEGARFILYGPFNMNGGYTAPSNEKFDRWLRQQDPSMGLRDLAWLTELATGAGLRLIEQSDMPANNMTLCWQKS